MRIVVCPGCGVKIKVPESRSGRCACPKCGKGLVIKPVNSANPAAPLGADVPGQQPHQPVPQQPAPQQPAPQQPTPQQPVPVQPAASGFPAITAVPRQGGAGKARVSQPRAGQPRRAAAAGVAPLKPFLKRLAIGLGILSGVLLLLTGLGMIAEPIAMVASGIGVLSAIVMLVGGKIWLLVIAFQESVVQGLLALFVPYYWMIYIGTRKGRALLPLAVMLSAMVPVLLSLAMVAVFSLRYEGAARSLRSSSRSREIRVPQATLQKAEDRLRQAYASSAEQDVLRTVSFQTYSQLTGSINPTKAEQALSDLPGYVAGSFRFDETQRIVMFQFKGDKQTARQYAYFLPAKANLKISLTPKFIDNADHPATNVRRTNPVRATPPKASRPAVVNTVEAASAEFNALQTVSFPTLGQSGIDSARAEQVLGEVSGFVPGSFRFDQEQQRVTLQYRGTQATALQYAIALQGKMFITLRMKPTFAAD